MRSAALLTVVGVLVLVAVLAARDPESPRLVVVDERRGVLGGIRFGASQAEVRARHGEPTDDHEGFFPRNASYSGPLWIPSPRGRWPPTMPTPLHYDDTSYLFSPTAGVFSMATTAPGARTRGGVGIGDDLHLVLERYRRVSCSEFDDGEGHWYQWCRAIVGDVRVFFGADPIEFITLTSYR